MIIERTSPLTGKKHKRDLDITLTQLNLWESKRLLIQDAFPDLSAEDREFIMTGITPEEWDDAFKDKGK